MLNHCLFSCVSKEEAEFQIRHKGSFSDDIKRPAIDQRLAMTANWKHFISG